MDETTNTTEETRKQTVQIRVSGAEYNELSRLASEAHFSAIGTYMRFVALNVKIDVTLTKDVREN